MKSESIFGGRSSEAGQEHVLVTGGAGFIGSHLCERLLAEGYLVSCLDNFDPYYSPDVKRQNLAGCLQSPNFQLIKGDILDADLLDAVLPLAGEERGSAKSPAKVIHLAALAGVRPSVERPAQYMRVNLEGTVNLLEQARKSGVTHFVFGSTSAVYGVTDKVPFSEEDHALRVVSPYGASKRAAELVCWTFHHLYGLPVTVLRFFTVYGPRQRPDMAIHKFAQLMLQGQPIPIFGDGTSSRDYTYVDDIVEGIVLAMRRPDGLQVFNLGNSRPVQLNSMVQSLGKALGVKAKMAYYPEQPGDVPITCADISKARRMLSWSPAIPLEQGLRKFAGWMLERSPEVALVKGKAI